MNADTRPRECLNKPVLVHDSFHCLLLVAITEETRWKEVKTHI